MKLVLIIVSVCVVAAGIGICCSPARVVFTHPVQFIKFASVSTDILFKQLECVEELADSTLKNVRSLTHWAQSIIDRYVVIQAKKKGCDNTKDSWIIGSLPRDGCYTMLKIEMASVLKDIGLELIDFLLNEPHKLEDITTRFHNCIDKYNYWRK